MCAKQSYGHKGTSWITYHISTEISIRVGIAQDWHGSNLTLNAIPWAISKGSDSIL